MDVKNDGTIDAMIDSITKTINNSATIPNYLVFNVTYDNGAEIEKYHYLRSNHKKTYKVRIEYKSNILPSDLPEASQNLGIAIDAIYTQATSDAKGVEYYLYSVADPSFTIGEPITDEISSYYNYEDAILEFGTNTFLRFYVIDDIVEYADVGILYNEQIYYIRGSGSEYNELDGTYGESIYYENNKAISAGIFGEDKCTENDTVYVCIKDSTRIRIFKTGNVYITINGDGGGGCGVLRTGSTHCFR